MSGRVKGGGCCENNDAFREGIAHKSLWKLIARKRPSPPLLFSYFRQSPRPVRYLSPVNPRSEEEEEEEEGEQLHDLPSCPLLFFFAL